MLLDLLGCLVLFPTLVFGVGWPLASRLELTAPETLLATTAFSLLGIFLSAWVVYAFALPFAILWALPVAALAGLAGNPRRRAAIWQDAGARAILAAQGLVSLLCLGWLGSVSSYSGGGWAGDWYEHWERARFFLEHWALETKILGVYLLPARPPLANVVTSAFLVLSRPDFAHFQLFITLLASLAFLPAALLAHRFFVPTSGQGGATRAVAVLAVLLMVNPLFVQNAVFAWTKLPAAFFILGGLWFFLRARDIDGPPQAGMICGVLLAAGFITHYSAGPYVVVLATWWFVAGRRHWHTREWQTRTALTALLSAFVLATWFGWSVARFGPEQTFLSNSSITSGDVRQGDQFTKIGLNIFDTLVPHFLRDLDTSLIDQPGIWSGRRDWFFQSYQLNLPLAFGSVAWLAILYELGRARRDATRSAWTFWKAFVGGTVFLGIAVHGARDHWGLAHICLQPIVLLGLSFLASRWQALGSRWQFALIAGAIFDFFAGIALHFGLQNQDVLQRVTHAASTEAAFVTLNEAAIMNYAGKVRHHLAFFSDGLPAPPWLLLTFIAAVMVVALRRTRAGVADPAGPVRR